MSQLIYLEDRFARDVTNVGGKAANLAKLLEQGVDVAPGLVVPVTAFDFFLKDNGWVERAHRKDPTLSADILSGAIAPELAGMLRTAAAKLGDCLIVRSSGVAEDGQSASWAGQLETIIGVRPGDETEAAVLKCWASAFQQRALEYLSGHAQSSMRMGVLIQPVIKPRCAGVMFTVNPLNGSWREMIVEAAWGQASPVVQGEVVPDSYIVRRPRRAPRPIQRVLARVRLDVVDDLVRSQPFKSVVVQGGLSSVHVEPAKVDAPKLRHVELLRLCRLGLKLEGLLGGPQDVEWALDGDGKFIILQTRPVTTQVGVRRTGPALWTRRFIGERWTEPATPLGWSLVSDVLDQFIRYPDTQNRLLGGGAATRLVRFAPYINVTIFRHLAFKMPGAPPPQFMMELLPPDEKKGWVRRRAQSPDMRVYASVLRETISDRRWRMFAANPFGNPHKWKGFLQRLDEQLPALEQPGRDADACMALADRCRTLTEQYVGIHICSLLWANLLYQLCDGVLLARGQSSLSRDLLRPIEESWTVRTNHALWRLGRNEIDKESFLQDYGHRAASSWEIFSPRWREAPIQVDVLSEAAAQHADPKLLALQQAQRAKASLERVSGPVRALVEMTQHYLLLRENQRFHFDRLLWSWKVQLVALESHMGLKLRFLTIAEVEALHAGALSSTEASARISKREIEWNREVERRCQGDEPPNFLIGAAVGVAHVESHRLQGTGASPGVVTGVVRILRTPEDGGRLSKGDILVARATDPGWTPLFLKAGGLVVELGGMLSHGAVVAREYGLPAVANVQGATTQLKEGQMVTIDGRQGVIWVR